MIAEKIKNLREKSGLTQAELARKLGLSRSGVNAWEMGFSIPSAQYLIGLANLFGVSTDYLLGVTQSETVDISSLSEDEKKIIYSLLTYFKENRCAVKIPEEDVPKLLEECRRIQGGGGQLPESVQKILDNFEA